MKHKLTTPERNGKINDPSCVSTDANHIGPRGSYSHLMSALTASITGPIMLSLLMLAAPLGFSDAHAKPKLIKTQGNKAKAKAKPKAKPKAKAKVKPRAKPKNLQQVKRPSRGNSRSTARARQRPTQSRQNLRRVKSVSRPKTSGQSGARSKPANTRTPSRSVRRVGASGSQLVKAGRSRSEGDQAGASRSGERSLVNTRAPANTRTPVNNQERRSVEDRSGQAGRAAQPGSKTVTTTTKTTKTKRVERSSRSSKTVERRRRRVERRQARRRERRRDRGGFGAPPARAPSNCRPRGGRTMLNFGIGSQSIDSDQREVALSFGGGYRAGLLGIAAEVQLASREEEEATLSALRGQFRLYLPMARCADLYPLLGVSSFHGDSDNTYAIDLGLGADLNIAGAVSLGARYTHSFFTERIRDIGNEDVESVNTFIVQIGVYF